MNATETATTTRNINLLTRDGVANVIASNPDLQALQAQVEALQAQLVAKANETVATHITVRGIELSVECAKWELQVLISKGNKVTDKVNKAVLDAVAKRDYDLLDAKQAEKELLVNINETGECLLEPVDAILYTDIAEALKSAGLSLQRQAIWATAARGKDFESKF
jgi:hypothetical protein